MLRPNKKCNVRINLETKSRNYSGSDGIMCANDGWVLIQNSNLLCGTLDKTTLGGNKKGIYYVLIRDCSEMDAALCMNRLAKMTSRW